MENFMWCIALIICFISVAALLTIIGGVLFDLLSQSQLSTKDRKIYEELLHTKIELIKSHKEALDSAKENYERAVRVEKSLPDNFNRYRHLPLGQFSYYWKNEVEYYEEQVRKDELDIQRYKSKLGRK